MSFSHAIDQSVVSLFSVWLPKGTVLYKGQATPKFDFSSATPCWFSLSETEASKYGPHVIKVTTKQKMLMLNTNSQLFTLHFVDYVNLKNISDKENILLPLGIPDITTQESIISKQIKGNRPVNHCKTNKELEQSIKYYENHSRYSGTNLDSNMVMEMIDAYGKYVQGYFQPTDRPSCWHMRFPSEVCIFNVSKIEFKEGGVRRKQRGGGSVKEPWAGSIPRQEMTSEEWRTFVIKRMQQQGSTPSAIRKFLARM
jgi:hypothetical protein